MPTIESVTGLGIDGTIVDSLVVKGRNLGNHFELRRDGVKDTALTRRSGSDTEAELELPVNILSGQHMLVATNAAGDGEQAIHLNLPEVTGNQIVDKLNDPGTTKTLTEYYSKAEIDAMMQNSLQVIGTTTLEVVQDGGSADTSPFESVNQALAFLKNKAIADDAIVTIAVGNGVYDYYQPIVIDHRDGARIHIVGSSSNNVFLRFPSRAGEADTGSLGLVIRKTRALGILQGVTLIGDRTATKNTPGTGEVEGTAGAAGISLAGQAWLEMDDVVIENFGGNGLIAALNSVVVATGLTTRLNRETGVRSTRGSTVVVATLTATDNRRGIVASYGSFLQGTGVTSAENRETGGQAVGGSYLRLLDASLLDNQYGAAANSGSSLTISGTVTGNSSTAISANENSYVDATGVETVSGGEYGYQSLRGSVILTGKNVPTGASTSAYNPPTTADSSYLSPIR